jgi:hypothetical protein
VPSAFPAGGRASFLGVTCILRPDFWSRSCKSREGARMLNAQAIPRGVRTSVAQTRTRFHEMFQTIRRTVTTQSLEDKKPGGYVTCLMRGCFEGASGRIAARRACTCCSGWIPGASSGSVPLLSLVSCILVCSWDIYDNARLEDSTRHVAHGTYIQEMGTLPAVLSNNRSGVMERLALSACLPFGDF